LRLHGILYPTIRKPPGTDAIANELAGILLRPRCNSQDYVAHRKCHGDDHLFRKAIEIVIEGVQLFTGIEMPGAVKVTQISFFFTSKLMIGLPTALNLPPKLRY